MESYSVAPSSTRLARAHWRHGPYSVAATVKANPGCRGPGDAVAATLAGVGDFRAVDARIARAQRHVADLEASVGAWVARPPYRWDMTSTPNGTLVERVDSILPAPLELAMIASDAIHQARAALDNAVGAIRPGGPTGDSEFPIRDDPDLYETAAARALAGLPDWATDLIRRMQPFSNDPWAYVGEELFDLHRMAREDRHRAPALHVALLRPDYVEGSTVEMRGDMRTWAEVEYRPGEVHKVHFTVKVEFVDPPLDGFAVVDGTSMLVRVAAVAVEQLRRADRAHAGRHGRP